MNTNGDSTKEDSANGDGSTVSGRLRTAALTGARALVLAVVALAGSITLFVLSVVSIVLVPVGIGIVTTPWVLAGVRGFANWRRLVAAQWCGVRIPPAYRPVPKDANPGRGVSGCSAIRRPGGT